MHDLRSAATAVVASLQAHGHVAVFAGGCVRDQLLGLTPKDYDIATSARPEQVEALFERTLPLGKSFGIVVVILDGHQLEVATLRADGQYGDGRRPDSVVYVDSLKEDAARRDLTINAMFFDPINEVVLDFFGGQEDLERGIIRSVGDPDRRIDEDRLRMLRVPRFASRFGFSVDPALTRAISMRACELTSGAKAVAFERIAQELKGILTSPSPLVGLDYLMDSGLMEAIIPELLLLDGPAGDQDPRWHPEGNAWVHTRMVVGNLAGSAFELMLAGLLHDIAKPACQVRHPDGGISNHGHAELGAEMADIICRRLKLANSVREKVVDIVALHMRMHDVEKLRPGKLAALLRRPDIEDLIAMQHADATGNGCLESKSKRDFLHAKLGELHSSENQAQRLDATPLVNGNTLIELGFKPGASFKQMLEEARIAQDEGMFCDPATANQWVLGNYSPGAR